MPIVFAFWRTAPSVRFIALATFATGVLAFECALSSRKSSLVHGSRVAAFLFSMARFLCLSSYHCRVAVSLQRQQQHPSVPGNRRQRKAGNRDSPKLLQVG